MTVRRTLKTCLPPSLHQPIAGLLHVTHGAYIAAKIRAKADADPLVNKEPN